MKLISFIPKDGFNPSHRKETRLYRQYTVIDMTPGAFRIEPVMLRTYFAGESAYACLWVHRLTIGEEKYVPCSGSGKASGAGYDKEAAAVQNAFRSAGIEFDTSFEGRIKLALEAFCQELGIEKYHISEAHG